MRYGVTVALVALATGLSVALGPVIEGNPFLLFHGTVAMVGWQLGLGPGLFAVALGGLVTTYVFLLPGAGSPPDLAISVLRLVGYFVVAATIAVATGSLRAARLRAESAVRARDDFLSIAAHELRTPVTSVRGGAQLLNRRLALEGSLSRADASRLLHMIVGQTMRLGRLIDLLLDVSRLEKGRLAMELTRTNLAALVTRTVDAAQVTSNAHSFVLTAPDEAWADVDPLRMEQVLANLLDNAVKFSPSGGTIAVDVRDGPTGIDISVRDHGLGIPAEHRGRLFERFYQGHGSSYRSGLGLGLHISQQIVKRHGGSIRAEFPDGGGSCFVITLPRSRQVVDAGQPRRREAE
jgi:signal transduction histidine kinase